MQHGNILVLGSFTQSSTSAAKIASGTTAQRPTGVAGMIRFNSENSRLELYNGTGWGNVGTGDGTVTSVSLSTTSAGLSVSGTVSTSGSLTINLTGELATLQSFATNGIVTRTGTATYAGRTITASSAAGAQGITLTNGDGVAGNPTVGLSITGLTAAGSVSSTDVLVINNGTNNVKATVSQLATAVRTAIAPATPYHTSFTNATLVAGVLTVTHNLGQKYVQVVIYDNNDKQVQPDEITVTSTTACTVDFTSFGALTGTWNVVVIG